MGSSVTHLVGEGAVVMVSGVKLRNSVKEGMRREEREEWPFSVEIW